MRVLIINKFLYPNGGSETYIFKLGEALEQHGHEVQYFGMEHEGRCVGNRVNAYTSDMDFHGGSKLSKLTYPIKTIYSKEARVQLRKVLDDFKPDVCHLNNFNYQLRTGNPARTGTQGVDLLFRTGTAGRKAECRKGRDRKTARCTV